MREIKFRAWAKYENTMMPDFQLHPDFGLLTEDQRFITMQYTGLKDKNGKEIYEGDVVKCPFDGFGRNHLISWADDRGGFWEEPISECRQFGYHFEGGNAQEIEVIGNIYENPELLEKP